MPLHIEQLKTTHRHMGEQHRCCVDDNEYSQLQYTLNDLKLSAQLIRTTLSVYDLNKRSYLLHAGSHSEAAQHPVFAWQSGITPDHYHDTIHPDDLQFVLEGHIEAYNLIDALPASEKQTLSLCTLFRMRNGCDGYRLVFFRLAVLRLDRNEKPWLLLINATLLADCAGKEVPRGYCLGSFAQRTDKLTLICNKASVDLLSNREYKVLCLIIAGYENYQIAEMLGITDHTVNEHRRNLARHFCAKNMPQAIVFALRMGLY